MDFKRLKKTVAISLATTITVLPATNFFPFYPSAAQASSTSLELEVTENRKISDIFPDAQLALVVANKMYKKVTDYVTDTELSSVKYITDGGNKGIETLEGIQNLTELSYASLQNNGITDLSPLANLPKLGYLELANNNITDISPLLSCPSLYSVNLNKNAITDMSPLKGKTMTLGYSDQEITLNPTTTNETSTLDLISRTGGTPEFTIKSGKGVVEGNKITWTTAGDNEIRFNASNTFDSSYTGVIKQHIISSPGLDVEVTEPEIPAEVPALEEGGVIGELFPDQNFAQVVIETLARYNLAYEANDYITFSELKIPKSISVLQGPNHSIESIDGIQYLTELTTIYLAENSISDISQLENLTDLTTLSIARNNISDVSALKNLTKLKLINMSYNNIRDISALENLTNLDYISLSNNVIDDVSVIKNFKKLKEVYLEKNAIRDVSDLKDIKISMPSRFLYNNQTIILDETEIGKINSLKLSDRNGNAPVLNITKSEGTYDNDEIKWETAGEKEVTFTSSANGDTFTGKIIQTVTDPNSEAKQGDTINNIFPDPAVANIIAYELNLNVNDYIEYTQLETIKLFNGSLSSIRSLEGLQYLKNLSGLRIEGNVVSDLTPIAPLTNLTYLRLGKNNISNLEPLRGLFKIDDINMSDNNISDVSPLQNLTNLRSLTANNNHISDLSPLKSLPKLSNKYPNLMIKNQSIKLENVELGQATPLQLLDKDGNTPTIGMSKDGKFKDGQLIWNEGGNKVVSWKAGAATAFFTGTISQSVSSAHQPQKENTIRNIFPDTTLATLIAKKLGYNLNSTVQYSELSQIEGLIEYNGVYGSPLTSLEGMQYLTGITDIIFEFNKISDLSPLKNLTKLTSLELSNNNIQDISVLENLSNLETLLLYSNNIQDISVLNPEKFPNLSRLTLGFNPISNYDSLGTMTSLTSLVLMVSSITDISFISELSNLTYLNLDRNHITDITPLQSLSKLKNLSLDNNNISDISVLADVGKSSDVSSLTDLVLSNNNISDISVLATQPKISHLQLDNCGLTDISALANHNLSQLSIKDNQISDISPIANSISTLGLLYFSNNNVTDISVLDGFHRLLFLNMSNNNVTDFSVLDSLPNLYNPQL